MANAQVNVKFISNSRGGHEFRVKTRRRDTVHWRCCKAGCPETINTANNLITTYRNIHNHLPDEVKLKVDVFFASMIDTVQVEPRPVPSVYQEELNKLRCYEVIEVPTLYSVSASLYRARPTTLPPLLKQRHNINLPDIYEQTTRGQNFLLHAEDDNKLLIFSTADNVRHLATSDMYYRDGPFSMCQTSSTDLFHPCFCQREDVPSGVCTAS